MREAKSAWQLRAQELEKRVEVLESRLESEALHPLKRLAAKVESLEREANQIIVGIRSLFRGPS